MTHAGTQRLTWQTRFPLIAATAITFFSLPSLALLGLWPPLLQMWMSDGPPPRREGLSEDQRDRLDLVRTKNMPRSSSDPIMSRLSARTRKRPGCSVCV